MERLSKTKENCQIHSQLIQYISIYILFHLFSLVLHVRKVATINSDRTVSAKLTAFVKQNRAFVCATGQQ